MIWYILTLTAGLFVGVFVGLFVAGLLQAGSRRDGR